MRIQRLNSPTGVGTIPDSTPEEELMPEGNSIPSGEDSFEDDDLFKDDMTDDYYDDAGGIPPIEKHKDLLKDLTNFDPYLKDLFNNWLGIAWNEEKKKYIPNPSIRPIMTLKGAVWCSSFLKTYTRQNNIITDVSSEEYKQMMMDVIETIWLNLGTREELGVKNEGDLIRVSVELEHAIALVLMGAGDGKYNQFLGTTYTSHSNSQDRMNSPLVTVNGQQQNKQLGGIVGRIKRTLVG